jgi:hypothetical protein
LVRTSHLGSGRRFSNLADRQSNGMQFHNNAIDLRMRHTLVAWQIALMFVSSLVYAPWDVGAAEPTVSRAMKKLGRAFVGDWSVVETFEQSDFFPRGGTRAGVAHFSIGTGGTSLIEDYHSDGPAGKLDFLMVMWWDADAGLYRLFTCSNNDAGKLRGTAYWEKGTLVNDYAEVVNGKLAKFQDRFSTLTSRSLTLVAGINRDGKRFEPLITTIYQRNVQHRDSN